MRYIGLMFLTVLVPAHINSHYTVVLFKYQNVHKLTSKIFYTPLAVVLSKQNMQHV